MTWTVTAFLCAIHLSSAQCDRASAQDILVLGNADNELSCMLGGQMTLAQLAIQPGPGERWIIKCTRTTIADGNVG